LTLWCQPVNPRPPPPPPVSAGYFSAAAQAISPLLRRRLFLCCCDAGYFSPDATPAISLLMRFDVSLPVCWLFLCVFAGYFSAVWLTVRLILRCDIVNLIRC